MSEKSGPHEEITRRALVLGGAGVWLSACRIMSQVRSSDVLLASPSPDVWHPVLLAVVDAVLPFAHPSFPRVSPLEIQAELLRLFPIDRDEGFAALPKAFALFDERDLFEVAPAPFVDAERRDLAMARVATEERQAQLETKLAHDGASWRAHRAAFGSGRFTELTTEGRRAYLELWAGSELITRRRFYSGARALVTVTAYSMTPFWETVGYEGPFFGHR